jgi:hypothetical protein
MFDIKRYRGRRTKACPQRRGRGWPIYNNSLEESRTPYPATPCMVNMMMRGQIGPSDAKKKKEAGNCGSMQRSLVMTLDFVLILTRNHVRLDFSRGVDYYSHFSHHGALSVSLQEAELLGGLKPLLASRSCCLVRVLTLQFDRPSLPITLTSISAVSKPCWLNISISCIVACCTVVP